MKLTGTETLRSRKTVKRHEFPATAAAVDATLGLAGVFSTRLRQQ
jgi:hypothetical protein